MNTPSRRFLAPAFLLASAASSHALAQVLAETGFDASADGWALVTTLGATPAVTWSATGGNPGGHVSTVDFDAGTTYWSAPAAWLNLLHAAYGGRLQFDAKVEPGDLVFEAPDVIIESPAGTMVIDAGPHPGASWMNFEVSLRECTGWRIGALNGAVPTAAQFAAAVQGATALKIRGEYRNGTETDRLDNVRLLSTSAGSGPQTSTFDAGIEGWGVFNDANTPTWNAAGQYLQVIDQGTGIYWYFVAPSRYRGEHGDLYGQHLTYDFWTNFNNSNPASESSVVIVGGGRTIFLDLALPAVNVWNHYDALLAPGLWRVNTYNGPVATEEDIRAVLGCVTQLRIRGEYSTSLDTGRLDNVSFGDPIPACPADFNGDGFLDFFDYDDYIACFETGTCPPGKTADFNGDGFADFFDYDDFVAAFEAGC